MEEQAMDQFKHAGPLSELILIHWTWPGPWKATVAPGASGDHHQSTLKWCSGSVQCIPPSPPRSLGCARVVQMIAQVPLDLLEAVKAKQATPGVARACDSTGLEASIDLTSPGAQNTPDPPARSQPRVDAALAVRRSSSTRTGPGRGAPPPPWTPNPPGL